MYSTATLAHIPLLVFCRLSPLTTGAVRTSRKFPEPFLPYDKPAYKSIYIQDYEGQQGERAQRVVRTDKALESGPFDGTSTTKNDFQAWPQQKTASFKPSQSALHSDAPFDGSTNYNKDFVNHPSAVRQPFKPKATVNPDLPWEGNSTQREDFKNHGRVEPPRAVRPAETVVKSAPFDAQSTHARDFHNHPNATRRSFKPNEQAHRTEENRDFGTEQGQYGSTRGKPAALCRPAHGQNSVPENRDFRTETHANFDNKGYVAERAKRPENQYVPSGPFDGTSTTKNDFQAWPQQKTASFKPTQSALHSDAPFDASTNYSKDYVNHPSSVRQPFKPKATVNPDLPWEGNSTQREDFKNHGRVEPPRAVRPSETVVKSAPFDATSTHARDFHQHPNATRRSFKPNEQAHRTAENRDFGTEQGQYGSTRGKPAALCRPANGQNTVPENRDFRTETHANYDNKGYVAERAKRPENQYVPSGPFDGTSTTKNDFQAWPQQKTSSFKPAQSALHSDAPFDGSTNYNKDYINHPSAVRQPFKPKATVNPDLPWEGNSTQREDFKNHGRVEPPRAVRPAETVVKSAPFDATSTHARDFHQHPSATRRSFKPNEQAHRTAENRDFGTEQGQYGSTRGVPAALCRPANGQNTVPENRDFRTETHANYDNKGYVAERAKRPENQYVPSGPFDGTSTTKNDFQAWPQQKTASFKPAQSALHSDAPFDSNTNYNNDYIARPVSVRQPFKPKATVNPDLPWEGNSTAREDYKNHGRVEPSRAVRPAETVVKSAPFDAQSTHARDFHQHPNAMRRSFKPHEGGARDGEDRDFKTDHRANYVLYDDGTYKDRTQPAERMTGSFRYLR